MNPSLDEATLAYRPAGAAKAVGLSEREIYNLLSAGRIKAKRHGRAVLIPRAELQRFIDDLEASS